LFSRKAEDTLKSTYEHITKEELLLKLNDKIILIDSLSTFSEPITNNISLRNEINSSLELLSNSCTIEQESIYINNISTIRNNIPIFLQNFINNKKENIILQASKLYLLFKEFFCKNYPKINFDNTYNSTKFGLEIKNYKGIGKKRHSQGYEICIIIETLKKYLIRK